MAAKLYYLQGDFCCDIKKQKLCLIGGEAFILLNVWSFST